MIFKESRVEPIIVLETDNPSISYNFAKQRVDAIMISNRLVERSNPNRDLLYYKILSRYSKRNAYMYYSKGRYVTAAMKRFMELLISHCDD